ncbi:MAG: hypothetical protein Q9162_004716 [Coniocarpon cinnabarinum]
MERSMRSSSFFSPIGTPFTHNSNDKPEVSSRFQAQLDKFSQSDQERNELMDRLLHDNNTLQHQVELLQNDLDNEQRSRRFHQDEAKKHKLEWDRATARTDNDPFCLVLVDGDGYLKAFEQAFCNAQSLFSIVDVGRGKERADHKIKEMFKLFVNNSHCRHLVFGGCHDNGYIPNLNPYRKDPAVTSRLTLLETTPAEWQYRELGFDVTRFPSVFRNTPLPEHRQVSPPQPTIQPILSPSANAFVPNGNVFSPSPAPARLPSPVASSKPPTPAPNGTASGLKTYATVGGPTDTRTLDVKAGNVNKKKKVIYYNEEGVRLDPVRSYRRYRCPHCANHFAHFQIIPRADSVQDGKFKSRVAATGKLCNNYHLRGNCYNGSACQYSHDPPISEGERLAFRHRVRTTLCPKGSQCDDFDCYLGHNCPFGDREGASQEKSYFYTLKQNRKTVLTKALGKCSKPDTCSFYELHGIDYVPKQKYTEGADFPEILKT